MILRPRVNEGIRVTISSKIPRSLKARLDRRATQSGYKLSAVVADLLNVALELEDKLEPFRPAIERLIREDQLSLPEAIVELLWMGVELDPTSAG